MNVDLGARPSVKVEIEDIIKRNMLKILKSIPRSSLERLILETGGHLLLE